MGNNALASGASEVKYLRTDNLITPWAAVGFILGLVFMFVALVTYRTLATPTPPVEWGSGHGKAWQTQGSTIFEYWRVINIKEPVTGTVHRRVVCDYEGLYREFDLPQLVREYKPGAENGVHRMAQWPALIPTGTKCTMHTYVMWWPNFSMVGHQVELSPIDFVVQENP